jgi:acetyl-CoA carboxylase alpha subunit
VTLPVPTIAVIIGEGGSEAALAFGAANRLLMMENAIFQPMAPEIAASILYRDSGRAGDAAEALRITAADCVRLGVVDGIVPEPVGGAHSSHEEAARELKQALLQELTTIQFQKRTDLVRQRYRKLRGVGRYSSYLGVRVRQEVGELGDAVGRGAAAIVSRIRHPHAGESERPDEGLLIP